MQYNVTVTFRDGSTFAKDFDDMEKADRFFNRYNNMVPDRNKPTTQVARVRSEISNIDNRTGRWYGHQRVATKI